MIDKKIKKAIILQHDNKDCGAACLKTIIRYYGGDASLEKLRRESGTTTKGASMLGLLEAAEQCGLEAEGFEAEIIHLKELTNPVILHISLEGNYEHYIVYFGNQKVKYIIGDPAEGLKKVDTAYLEQNWKSGVLLCIKPTANFKATGFNTNKSLQWLKENLIKDKPIFMAAIFLGIIIAFLSLSTAVFTEVLVDDVLPQKSFMLLIKGLISWSVLLLMAAFLSYLRDILMVKQGIEFNKRTIGYFLSKLIYLPKPFFDSKKQGDMVARLNDSQKIQSAVQYVLNQALIDSLILVASFSFLFYYNVQIALFALGIIPLLLLLIKIYLNPIKGGQHLAMHYHAINESNYIETINGIDTIKCFQREDYYKVKAQKTYSLFQTSVLELQNLVLRFNLSGDFLNTICTILTVAFASFLYVQGQIKMGELIASITIVSILIASVESLLLANINIQSAKVALERMFEFTEEQQEDNVEQFAEPIRLKQITIDHLSFAYPGQEEMLTNISLTLSKGEILTVLGENGCGKSTLTQILQKNYCNYDGEIRINDIKLSNIPTSSWRKIIGIVPQNIKIFNGSVIENICLDNADLHTKKVIEFCKDLGLDRFFSKFHHGYNTLVGEEGINLSGGEKQLVALARALYRNPQLLILDEATSAMDRETERYVLNIIKKQKKYKTILFITHRLHIIKFLESKIAILQNGCIHSFGNHDTLIMEENLYSKYWNDLAYA